MSERQTKKHFKQIVLAIKLCHSKNIVHKDIKAENVIFEDNSKRKCILLDFGIGKIGID